MSPTAQRRRGADQAHRDGATRQGHDSTPAIAPLVVSDRTCAAALGLEWRSLRAWCREHGIAISRIGRRPVVRVVDVLAALEPRAQPQAWRADDVVRAIGGGR